MTLLADVLRTHGGVDRWRAFSRLEAAIVTGAGFWAMKGLVQDPSPRQMPGTRITDGFDRHR
jgi:hypothetical protein